ncbi:MAG: GGDEF domain-containing protein [Planctomycetota bacterium]
MITQPLVDEYLYTITQPAIVTDVHFNILKTNTNFVREFELEPSGNLKQYLVSGDNLENLDKFIQTSQPFLLVTNLIVNFGRGKVEIDYCSFFKQSNFIIAVMQKKSITKSREHLQQTIELQKNTLRIHALTEKIRHIPIVVSQILTISQEEEFFNNVTDYLTREPELGIKDIKFYLLKNKKLLLYIPEKGLTEFKDTTEYPKIMKIITTKEPFLENQTYYYSLLIGRQNIWGVIKITLDEFEVKLIFENQLIARGYVDALESIAKILGIFFDNLVLYEKLEELSITDQLTNAYNRRFFDKKIKEELIRAKRYKKDLSLLLMDLDNLKEINDRYGHLVGDEALVKMAHILLSNLRTTDYLCRYGGDEFAIIMPETSGYDAFYKAELLRKLIALEDIVLADGTTLNITVSIGVGEYTDNIATEEELIKKADNALYLAKSKGKNMVV